MTAPATPHVVADTGGLVVTDDGRRMLIFDRGTGPLAVGAFGLGVVALVAGGFGAVALFALTPTIGAAFLAAGVIAGVAAALAYRTFRRRRGRPLQECGSVAVIDRKLNLFSYAGGAVIQLDQVRFARTMQLGSSSPKLVAVMPGGTRVLKRGNPFDGGVGNVDEILMAAVYGAPR